MRRNDVLRLPSLVCIDMLAGCASHSARDPAGGLSPYPAQWVAQQIAAFEANRDANRVAGKVVHNGTALYLIDSPCCDFCNYLYTAEGKISCAPSGGFNDHGDGKCPPGLEPAGVAGSPK